MALEQVFFDPRTLKRFRAGPLASKLAGFCEWLCKRGFACFIIRRHISNVSYFREWAHTRMVRRTHQQLCEQQLEVGFDVPLLK